MAELTVDGLGELTSPAANDEIGIWDVSAGQYLKIRRDTLVGGTITGGGTIATGGFTLTVPATGTAALLSQNQNFSGMQSFSSALLPPATKGNDTYSIDMASSGFLDIADNAVANLTLNTSQFSGLLLMTDYETGVTGLFVIGGPYVMFVNESYPGRYSHTKDTPGRINVYGESSHIKIQNKQGAGRSLYVFTIRTRIG